MFALTVIILLTSYLCFNLLKVAHKNKKAFQFFKEHQVHFPVLENPGPFAGHLNKVIYCRKNWRYVDEFHQKYGRTFGYYFINQAWVSTIDLDLLKAVYTDQSSKHLYRSNLGTPVDDWNNSILQLNGESWRRNRLPIASAIRKNAVKGEELSRDIRFVAGQLKEALERRLDKVEKLGGKREIEVNLDEFFQRYTAAVIYLVGYKQKNIIDFDATDDQIIRMIRKGSEQAPNIFVNMAFRFNSLKHPITFLSKFTPFGTFMDRTKKHLLDHVRMNELAINRKKVIEEMKSDIPGEEKYNRRLLDVMADELIMKNVTQDEFLGNMLFMLLSGILTTADTITCLLWLLAQNPDIQEKLRKTLREEGTDADYVTWCIFETVRWHPAVPLYGGRELSEDITVNGNVYPKGLIVTPSTYSLHHDPNIWPDPEVYNPERWKNRENFHPNAFMGFGLGPRSCPGTHLAIQEIRILLQMLLSSYKIEKCPKTTDKIEFSAPGLVYCFMDQPVIAKLVRI